MTNSVLTRRPDSRSVVVDRAAGAGKVLVERHRHEFLVNYDILARGEEVDRLRAHIQLRTTAVQASDGKEGLAGGRSTRPTPSPAFV